MITVAIDGSGDFLTVNEALQTLTTERDTYTQIYIKNGEYNEQITMTTPFVELIGEDVHKTKLTYGLYATMPSDDIGKLGTFRTYSFLIDTHDVKISNLTIENSSGPGKKVGQAIAAYVDGDRILFENCRLIGGQDTLFTGPLPPKEIEKNGFIGPKQYAPRINGRHYYKDCFITGDVDFIFGSATAFFETCEIYSKNTDNPINGYVTAASTPEGQAYGYVFDHCRFTGDCPKDTVYLGRPWRNFAQTIIMNSYIGDHIRPEGWHDWNKEAARNTVLYGEYGNYGPSGSLEQRESWVKRLTAEEVSRWSREKVLSGTDGWTL